MSVYKRGFIFVTFLGSCLSIVLLAAAFGTKYWVIATAKNVHNLNKSNGKISMGLFEGEKSLNIGYGLRTHHINVLEILKSEPEMMIYSLWVCTVGSLTISLLFAVISAMFAVINSATRPVSALTGIPGLYLWNILAVLFEMATLGAWLGQYYKKLRQNVLIQDDRKLYWTSNGMAYIGYSFWFVVVSIVLQLMNLIFISYATKNRSQKSVTIVEEKGNGAIMLY